MIYLILGQNKKVQGKISEICSQFPNASVKKMFVDDFHPAVLEEWIIGDDLFSEKYIFCLNNICKDKAGNIFILEKLDDLLKTDKIFIWQEDNLETKLKKRLQKIKEGLEVFDFSEEEKGSKEYNFFPLLDALGVKNKKQLWILYQEALMSGSSADDIFWKMKDFFKNLYLIKTSENKDRLNFKPFFIKKMSGFANNFSAEEIKELFNNLIEIYYRSLNETGRLEKELELLILKI